MITHGNRGFAYEGTDVRLPPQAARRDCSAHRRVVSNRLSTAVLYGASVGCEVGVYGDPMVLHGEDPVYGGVERQLRTWPELHQEYVDQELVEATAHRELGIGHLRTPAEIRDLFGWRGVEGEEKR